jgi:hypothetical protein
LIKNFHVFLENLSGDIFTYDKEKKAWIPIGNIGLHNYKAKASIEGNHNGACQ